MLRSNRPPPALELGDKSPPLYQPLVSFSIAEKDFINASPAPPSHHPTPRLQIYSLAQSVSSNHN